MDNGKKMHGKIHRLSTRRLAQLYSALLYNAHLKGFIEGEIYTGKAKYACVPGLNCYSCPGAVGACPLGALQNALAVSGHRAGWYVLGILILFGVCLGRMICGWLCPLGLIQELLHKIPTPKLKKSVVTRSISLLKYVVLTVFVIALPLWYGLRYDLPLPAFCKYICPAGTFEGAVALLSNSRNAGLYGMLGILFTRKFIIMLAIGLVCVSCYRSFCRFLCPLGAIYGLFNRFCLVGVRVDAGRCNDCGACVNHCEMDVRRVGDRECIHCAKCMDVCAQNAISLKAGNCTLKVPVSGSADDAQDAPIKRKKLSHILLAIALAALCFALLWFNFLDPSIHAPKEDIQDSPAVSEIVSIGAEPGMQLEDFTITCLDDTSFHLADYRGKVVFLNLWATYCTPCVQELPYFSILYQEHSDDIGMLAVHASLMTDDPAEYAADKNWSMPIAIDTEDRIWSIVGGSSTLPQTIVLDRGGVIVYNQVGSVTLEMLEVLYQEAAHTAHDLVLP